MTWKRNFAYSSVCVGEMDLYAYVPPALALVSRATQAPPLGEVTPWVTVRPVTLVHAASVPLSKSSANRTPIDGVVTRATLLSSDVFPEASRARTV